MNSNLTFEFNVNKDNKSVEIKRAFNANLASVWLAWTTPEILDLWWAPKPYITETKSMDFTEGGSWLYSMVSPTNERHWCIARYQTIHNLNSFSYTDAFCDEEGNVGEEFPGAFWTNHFIEKEGITTVEMEIIYRSLADLEKIIAIGFKEGFTMAMSNLDQYFESKK